MISKTDPLIFLFVVLLISACTPTPPDVPACEYLHQHLAVDPVTTHLILKPSPACMAAIGEAECGHCTTIVTGTESYYGEGPKHLLNGKKWSDVTSQSVYLPAVESFAPLAQYVINSCDKMKCSTTVDDYRIKLNSLSSLSAVLGLGNATPPSQ